MTDNDTRYWELKHQSSLITWQKMMESVLHSDRAAVDIGIFVMKTMIVMNAGAVVTLIAAYPDLRSEPAFAAALPIAGKLFFYGLLSSIIAAVLAYFYQSLNTADEWNDLYAKFATDPGTKPPFPWAQTAGRWTIIAVLALLAVAFVLFLVGANKILTAFGG